MAAVSPSEEMGMAVLEKGPFGDRETPDFARQEGFENPEATLPWDQTEARVAFEASGTDPRPSPEGSRGEGTAEPAVEEEAFMEAPSAMMVNEEEESHKVPKMAPHAFVPIDPCCIERPPTRNKSKRSPRGHAEEEVVCCEKEKEDLEKQNFISGGCSARFDDLPSSDGEPPPKERCPGRAPCLQKGSCGSRSLKAVASMVAAVVIFPCLLYGAYVFLPFDAPLMPTMGSRLVYTLRCGAFATFPILVGMVVYGVSRVCYASLQPSGELRREVDVHWHYVSQSVHLFILYFFNLAVLSTYLPQEALKLIPLLTALFAISRLLYWLAYAMGRAFRGFGFGLTFLPLLAMLLFNLYSMFLVESESMFVTGDDSAGSSAEEEEERLAASKPRYWG